jgi:hypothetical protein
MLRKNLFMCLLLICISIYCCNDMTHTNDLLDIGSEKIQQSIYPNISTKIIKHEFEYFLTETYKQRIDENENLISVFDISFVTDIETGCQYIIYENSITPRLRPDGSFWCEEFREKIK